MAVIKSKRHKSIINIINNNDVETQEDLAERLKAQGFLVTQATVSRDIRELKLNKIVTGTGKQKYVVISDIKEPITDRQKTVFREGVLSLTAASNILVIKTLTGMAMGVAASLDAMNIKDIVGTIAGDDTIFSVFKSEQKVLETIEELNTLRNG